LIDSAAIVIGSSGAVSGVASLAASSTDSSEASSTY
jgi:NAD-dependent SIR2 family protein deacetylase